MPAGSLSGLAARLRGGLGRRWRRLRGEAPTPAGWPAPERLARPRREIGRVVMCKPRSLPPGAMGKIDPGFFLPPFAEVLAAHGLRLVCVETAEDLARALRPNSAVVYVYNEEQNIARRRAALEELEGSVFRAAAAGAVVVFNAPAQGRLIGDKRATAEALAAARIGVPEEVTGPVVPEGMRVFVRDRLGTQGAYAMLEPGAPLDPARYNTRLVDTRMRWDGRDWFTATRLMVVGRRVIHATARARDVAGGNASVHGSDMPPDPALMAAAHRHVLAGCEAELEALVARLVEVLGPGFWHLDMIRETGSGRFLVCEIGQKFNHFGNTPALFADLPVEVTGVDHAYTRTPEWGRRAAAAFIDEARRAGMRIAAA